MFILVSHSKCTQPRSSFYASSVSEGSIKITIEPQRQYFIRYLDNALHFMTNMPTIDEA